MKEIFGTLPNSKIAHIYTISCGAISARITDLGATLVSLLVPDMEGKPADVVLGYDSPADYLDGTAYLGATIGRTANRIRNASFILDRKTVVMPANEGPHNLHSGPNGYDIRLWKVEEHTANSITMKLFSHDGDQSLPGNAVIHVRYTAMQNGIKITYDAVADKDTVFNMTNHSYFNLAGHEHPEKAMEQILTMPARFFNPDDEENIPTGELRSVEGSPMDFRFPKKLARDIGIDFDALNLQGGYDHNFEVFCNPCAILEDPGSGRRMAVITDCPGIQLYTANFTDTIGKNGVHYGKRSGVCLETQYYPDAVNHPEWPQPMVKAGKRYHSETFYRFG